MVYSNTFFKEVRSYIITVLEYFKTVKYNWFIKITTNNALLTFTTIRLQTSWYECYNKNILYFSSLWRRLLFVCLIPNGSLYVLNSAAYMEMEIFPAVTIKVTVFSHATPVVAYICTFSEKYPASVFWRWRRQVLPNCWHRLHNSMMSHCIRLILKA
jgi:hypothetical protein